MKMKATVRKRRGYILLEMIMVVALVGVLAVLVGDLFMVSFGSLRDASRRDNLVHRVDAAVASLRRDVWAATNMGTDGASRAELDLQTGELVTWRMMADGALSRTMQRKGEAEQVQTWPGVPEVRFAVQGAMLKMSVRSRDGREETMTLVSEKMLQGRAK